MRKLYQIFLDMDGVVADWEGAAIRAVGLNPEDPDVRRVFYYNTSDGMALNKLVGNDVLVPTIEKLGVDFWENLDILPWARELYHKLMRLDHTAEVCFLTDPGNWPEFSVIGKLRWLKRHFNSHHVLFGKPKWLAAHSGNFLVDDKVSNVEKFVSHGGQGFSWPHQYVLLDGKQRADDALREVVTAAEISRDTYFESLRESRSRIDKVLCPSCKTWIGVRGVTWAGVSGATLPQNTPPS